MRRINSFIFVLFITVTLYSQTFRLSIEPGYGFYDMGKLHQIQEDGVNFMKDYAVKAVEKFPPYFNQSVGIAWYISPDFLIGLSTTFFSTGGRNSVKDYSGEYKLDMIVNAQLYGLETEYNYNFLPKLSCYLNLKTGIISSKLDFIENFVVSNTTLINKKNTLKESNLYIEPSTGMRYFINKSISLSLGVGYLIDFGAYSDNKIINWSGLHIKSGIAYSF